MRHTIDDECNAIECCTCTLRYWCEARSGLLTQRQKARLKDLINRVKSVSNPNFIVEEFD